MLVLSRKPKPGQNEIVCDCDCGRRSVFDVLEIRIDDQRGHGPKCRIGITAERAVAIYRGELLPIEVAEPLPEDPFLPEEDA